MSKNTQISELINYLSVDGSGNIVITGSLIGPAGATYATQSYVTTAISNLVNAAPTALDTLAELSAALNNDASFATTITNSLATKLNLSGGTLTGALNATTISTSVSATFGSDVFTYNNGGIFFSGGGSYSTGIFQNGTGLNLQVSGTPVLKLAYTTGAATFTGSIYLINANTRISSDGNGEVGINYGTTTTSPYTFSLYNNTTRTVGFTAAGAASFSSTVTASSFIKSGGTSTQFLKADGSSDSSEFSKLYSGGFNFQANVSYNGWVRIAITNLNTGGYGPRGAFKITVANTGNYIGPAQDTIYGYKDWGNSVFINHIDSYLTTVFTQYRITTDANYSYLEGYVNFSAGGDQSIAVYSEQNGHNGLQWNPVSGYAVSGLASPSTSDTVSRLANGSTFRSLYVTNNIGIGINNPADKLHVYSSATTGEIRLGGGNGSGNARMYFQAHATTAYIDMYGNNGYLPLQINASPLSFMGGNVAVGTTSFADVAFGSPILKVYGSRATLALTSTGSLSTIAMIAGADTSKAIHLNQENTGALRMYQYSVGAETFTLSSTGNLGLSVTNPSHRLQVSGNIYSTDTVFGRNLKPEGWASVSAGSPSSAGIPLGYSTININSVCDGNWRTVLTNINDAKFFMWVTLGDAASKDTASYSFAMTSPAYGVSSMANLTYTDGGWNTGGFEFTYSSANGTHTLLVRCTSYYNSGNTAYGTIYFLRLE